MDKNKKKISRIQQLQIDLLMIGGRKPVTLVMG